ncbi:MAG: hypothetical protein M3Q31_23710 [Actinomycetota bacterium]|nr:hypothetical protein [Actinomycetota bacterium]
MCYEHVFVTAQGSRSLVFVVISPAATCSKRGPQHPICRTSASTRRLRCSS